MPEESTPSSNPMAVDMSARDSTVSPESFLQQYNKEVKFPIRLHQMLAEVESDGLTEIVSWQPDGTSFKVHKQAAFVEKVLPRYFSQTKYRSFQRQLNHYGFERITKGAFEGSYRHLDFIKTNPERSEGMKRMKRSKVTAAPKTPTSTTGKRTINVVSPLKTFPEVQPLAATWYPAPRVSGRNYTNHHFQAANSYSGPPALPPKAPLSQGLEEKPFVSISASQQLDTIEDLFRLLDDETRQADFGKFEMNDMEPQEGSDPLSEIKQEFQPPSQPLTSSASTSTLDYYNHHFPRQVSTTVREKGMVATADYDEPYYFGPSSGAEGRDPKFYSYQPAQVIGL